MEVLISIGILVIGLACVITFIQAAQRNVTESTVSKRPKQHVAANAYADITFSQVHRHLLLTLFS